MRRYVLFVIIFLSIISLAFSYKDNEANVLFVGDMFFDRYIRQVMADKGGDYVFSCLDHFLKDSDLVVGNLEGPITDNQSRSLGSAIGSPDNFVFTFPSTTAELLADHNIKLINLGNNHIGNFGADGIFSTKRYLNKAGLKYFGGLGGQMPVQAKETVYRARLGGNAVSFLSYNEFGGDNSWQVAQKIVAEKADGRVVIVYAHWGEEYSAPPERVKETAKLFAKSGADFIIGSHPHVVLASELIPKDSFGQDERPYATVYYSLGNFIFDQYWNKEVSTGLVLELNIQGEPTNWTIVEHKVSLLRDGRACLKN